jgi:anti-sigma factor RsiW
MNEKHYKEKLSEFVNYELAPDERQAVAAHLLQMRRVPRRTRRNQARRDARKRLETIGRARRASGTKSKARSMKSAEKATRRLPAFAFFDARA